jgi:hypothetical protein
LIIQNKENTITASAFNETEEMYNITTFNEFKTVLVKLDSNSNIVININNNLTIKENIELRGKVKIKGLTKIELLLENAYIDIKNGTDATFENLNIIQNNSLQTISSAILYRDNSRQGSAYFYDCNITTNSQSVLKSTSINGRYFLNNTNLIGGDYSIHKGSLFISGASSYNSKIEATTMVYDFRNSKIIPSPNTDSFPSNAKASLSVDQKPVYFRGNNDETEKLDMDVYYTLDGTNPLYSTSRKLFNSDISLIVDRKIKAVMVSKLFSNIYSSELFEFTYDVNLDKSKGDLKSVETLDEVSIRCKTPVSELTLPEAILVTLNDGRSLYALVDWELSMFEATTEGSFELVGNLTLPYFVNNPNNLKAVLKINVFYNDIEDFDLNQYNVMQEGKNTAFKGYKVGNFTAVGGDEENYSFSFIDDINGTDNSRFEIIDDELIIKNSLKAGAYTINVQVNSASKKYQKVFELTVLEKGKVVVVVSNPYSNIDWSTINFVKTATHNHTYYSNGSFEKSEWSDSAFDTVDERVQRYVDIGYGAVIITEHDYVALDEVNGKYSNDNILKIYGNELSKRYHTLYYGLSAYYDNKGKGTSVTNGIDGNIEKIKELDSGFVYFAHPNRSSTDKDYWLNLFNKHDNIYGIEVFNAGQALANYSEDIWDYILSNSMPNRPIYGTASDDAHSNGSAGTGWTTLLLSESEMNDEGVLNALKNGNSFMGSICVNPKTDDDIMWDSVKGPVPEIKRIQVDNEKATIKVEATNFNTIEWVSLDGKVVATGDTISLNDSYGVENYIRVRIYGDNGMIHSQPFGLEFTEEYYDGIAEDIDEEPKPNDEDPKPNDEEKPGKDENKKQGCFSSILGYQSIFFVFIIIVFGIVRVYNKKKNNL